MESPANVTKGTRQHNRNNFNKKHTYPPLYSLAKWSYNCLFTSRQVLNFVLGLKLEFKITISD